MTFIKLDFTVMRFFSHYGNENLWVKCVLILRWDVCVGGDSLVVSVDLSRSIPLSFSHFIIKGKNDKNKSEKKDETCVCISPMMPLSLLSRVELGLVMVPHGLRWATSGRLLLPFKVEQGLSVHGDAVLLVRVEHGLILWFTGHCRERTERYADVNGG